MGSGIHPFEKLGPDLYLKIFMNARRLEFRNDEVDDPYRQVSAFRSRAQTQCIFATGLSPIFKFLLKSRNPKWLTMLPKTHSRAILTELIEGLNALCAFVSCPW